MDDPAATPAELLAALVLGCPAADEAGVDEVDCSRAAMSWEQRIVRAASEMHPVSSLAIAAMQGAPATAPGVSMGRAPASSC